MPDFSYQAIDKKGNEKEGIVKAVSYKDAFIKIKAENLYPTEIYQTTEKDYANRLLRHKRNIVIDFIFHRSKTKELVSFISDFSVLVDAGISLMRSLTVLSKQAMSKRMQGVILELRTDVEGGQSFSDALSKHPSYFSKLFINMIRAGEVGGIFADTLDRLAHLYEKNARLQAKLKAALTYPFVVLSFALIVVIFIIGVIVPKFFVIFDDIGTELPMITVALYSISQFVRNWWLFVIISFFVLMISFRLLLCIKAVRYVSDVCLIKLPVLGTLFSKVSISRFCRTFGTLLSSGVPILQTLSIAKDATGNMVYAQAIERVKESVKEGEGVAGPLSQYSLFPPLVTNMITVGEETGALAKMLLKISDRYDEEVDIMVGQISSLIEPFLLIGLGIVVGVIVAALFLPLVSIVENLTGF